MAVTSLDVQAICSSSLSDAVIDDVLCMVNARIGSCVTSSYPDECTQDLIIKYAACYFVSSMEGPEIKSERAANGASTNYNIVGDGEGLKSNQWGRLLINIDTAGCYSGLVADTFVFMTAGATDSPSCY